MAQVQKCVFLKFLLSLLASKVTAESMVSTHPRFKERNLPCPVGCEAHGNCNAEFGRCECRFGFGGDDCSKPLLPACMSSLSKGAVPQYGLAFPKNCYCYRQLQRIACSGEYWKNVLMCNQPIFWDWTGMRCYEYKDLPEQQQLSNPPSQTDQVMWKIGVREENRADEGFFGFAPYTSTQLPRTHNGQELLPLSRCKDRCNERGACLRLSGDDTVCRCAPFYTGPSCGEVEAAHCPAGCSGRGTCDGGFCHCQPGYWGAGCVRRKAYTADEWMPHPTELRIYVYDLPEQVSYMRPLMFDEWPIHHEIYLAEIEIYQRLLTDTVVRTENPWEANLFFVPTHTYYYIGNIGFPGLHFGSVFRYVRETFPWWNATAGRNHVAATSNDRGCCDLYRLGADVQHPIKLVHFAQAPRHTLPHKPQGDSHVQWSERPEDLAKRLRTDTEDPAMVGAMAEFQHLGGRPRFKGFPTFELPALQQEREQCFRPEHDVAFPPYISTSDRPEVGRWSEALPIAYEAMPDGRTVFNHKHNRDILFLFDGYTKRDMAYSAGVRQGLLALFGNLDRPDVKINKGGGPPLMLHSKFCFTPMGFGWGIRLSQAVYTGCVPVMTHDHVWPTLWDVLPYEKFSVRVSRHNLHRMFDYLESITPEQLSKLQDGLAEVHRAFIWQPELRGLAYNYTLLSLHHKLLNMWTAFFK